MRGLSPRVRGNRRASSGPCHNAGSIPARAGEPIGATEHINRRRVYPRACGGTIRSGRMGADRTGLSPRVRGNHLRDEQHVAAEGSIPARAGEPELQQRSRGSLKVYPRACGGTLSETPAAPCPGRSIPARAGEPGRANFIGRRLTVYPRACGGTSWEPRL